MKILVIPKAIIVLAAFIYTGWFAANVTLPQNFGPFKTGKSGMIEP